MPAIDADIGPAMRAATVQTWSDATVRTRYPSAADGSAEPAEGFFNSAGDAFAAIGARGALIGVERRRFEVAVRGAMWLDPAPMLPTVTLVDAAQSANGPVLITRIEVDLNEDVTNLELWG